MLLPDVIEVAVSIALAALAPVAYRRGGWGGLWVGWGTVATLVIYSYANYGLQLFGFAHRYPHESLAIYGFAIAAVAHVLFRLRVNTLVTVVLVALALAAVLASHMVVVDPLFTS